jgi:3,4-dihydroxy-9,10-secoandrosta-1,3,5(10)-triene-9,17-dione 4,5-dioxygenase
MSGVRALGYIVVQGPVGEWKSFGIDLLGAQVARHTAGEVRLRTDERAWRISASRRKARVRWRPGP